MNSKLALNQLEIALLEFEYAAADFLHHKTDATELVPSHEFDGAFTKSMDANRMLLTLLGALREGRWTHFERRVA